jgi:hypothetical protein
MTAKKMQFLFLNFAFFTPLRFKFSCFLNSPEFRPELKFRPIFEGNYMFLGREAPQKRYFPPEIGMNFEFMPSFPARLSGIIFKC